MRKAFDPTVENLYRKKSLTIGLVKIGLKKEGLRFYIDHYQHMLDHHTQLTNQNRVDIENLINRYKLHLKLLENHGKNQLYIRSTGTKRATLPGRSE